MIHLIGFNSFLFDFHLIEGDIDLTCESDNDSDLSWIGVLILGPSNPASVGDFVYPDPGKSALTRIASVTG